MALLLALTVPALLTCSAAASTNTPPSCWPTAIKWKDCAAENDTPTLKCANISVPLDYSKTCDGKTVRLALAMRPAQVHSERLGSLFFNTGGPGGPALIELIGNGTGLLPFPDDIRDKFDLVAMDPRAIGASQPITCDHHLYNEAAALNQFPASEEEFDALYSASRRFGQSCLEMTGPLLENVDSRTVAQDFEVIRQALGHHEKMNYIGLSYGTVIGQAYLELFPEHVRAMVLDGNVEHSQRQPYAVLTESRTYENVLDRFFDWCDSNTTCAIHNKNFSSAKLWDRLIAQAQKEPLPAAACADPVKQCVERVSASDIMRRAQESLIVKYPVPGSPFLEPYTWPSLAEMLKEAYYNRNATAFSRAVASSDTTISVATAVIRNDWNVSVNTFPDLQNVMQLLQSTSPHTKGICEFYGWMLNIMAWPIQATFPEVVPQFKNALSPVLLVNAYYDPESSYDWAVALQNEIPGSVLLTRDGDGHTSYLLKGDAYRLMNEYLVDLKMPAPNTIVNS